VTIERIHGQEMKIENGLFIFLHVRHVREEKEEEEHDGRIKKNKGYTTTRLCWWVTKRKELKSFLKFKRPALFIF